MANPLWRKWRNRFSWYQAGGRRRPASGQRRFERPTLERLEDRTMPSVTIAGTNNNGNGYTALDFNQSGGYTPPDTCGAAGPTNSSTGLGAYVETVNQTVALYTNKAAGSTASSPNAPQTSSLSNFWFTTGGLAHADSGSSLSDPIVVYDDQIGRFIVGDQDVDFNTHVSRFDLAVSKSSEPASLTTSDWNFFQINTTQSGFDADYPGNFGYNHDAFVFTVNMFNTSPFGSNHAQVVSVDNNALINGTPLTLGSNAFSNNVNDLSVRPTTMHDSVAGDPMWLVTEHGDGKSIDVIKDTNVLSTSPTFTYTNLAVTPYSGIAYPLNPNGTDITNNIDTRIMKAAEWNDTLVASHSVGVSSTEDDAQWYAIDVSSGTPVLKDQGRLSGGNNTYVTYPTVDINSSGQIGMTYLKSGTDSSTDYMSMYVTGRDPSDAAGTMETPVLVPAGKGQANYADFSSGGRAGDLSGINVDPSDGSFWAANEFANTEASANWGTAVANFTISNPFPSTDMAVSMTGPSSIDVSSGSTNVTYTITLTNNGPNAAQGVVLSDLLPSGSSFVSLIQAAGSDSFTQSQSGGSVTASATGSIAANASDTFSLVVSAPGSLANGAAFNNTASITANNPDLNTANNSATVEGTVTNTNPDADLSVSVSGPSSTTEGTASLTYTITVSNAGPASATGVTVTDTLGSLLKYQSAAAPTGATSTVSGGVVTFSLGTIASGGKVTASVTAQAIEDGSTSDTVSASSSSPDPNSANNSASATISIAEPAISVSGSITTKSKSLSGFRVATFTHANGVEPASAFLATINWGDGTTSTGTITQSGTTYSVYGSHTYSGGNKHTIKTTVSEAGNSGVSKADVDPGSLPPNQRDIVRLTPDNGTPGGPGDNHNAQTPAVLLADAAGSPALISASALPTNGSVGDWLTDLIALETQVVDQLYHFGIENLQRDWLELEQLLISVAESGDSAA